MTFQFFDPQAEVQISSRNLPHREQAGATYFITFRTADSMPRKVMDGWLSERNAWLRMHGVNPDHENWRAVLDRLPQAQQKTFHTTFTRRFHDLLDFCHGACVLKSPALARIVADSLRHFDGERYVLGDFVVMPNHVHLLAQFSNEGQLTKQCRSWKKFTAGKINEVLRRQGVFWQDESFDHLVRSAEQFAYLRNYITDNPSKAKLTDGQFYYYRRAD